MRFSTVFSVLAVVVSGAMATATYTPDTVSSASGLTAQNYYGAPILPWKTGHYPGWYYGQGNPPAGIAHVLNGVSVSEPHTNYITHQYCPALVRNFGLASLRPPLPEGTAPCPASQPAPAPFPGVYSGLLRPYLRSARLQLPDLRLGRHRPR